MVESLKQAAADLLAAGTVNVVIGYGEGTSRRVRPVFVREADGVSSLVFDERCKANLAVYLPKPGIVKMGKAAIVARPPVVRSIIQLIAEHQLSAGTVVVLAVDEAGVRSLTDASSLEAFAAGHPPELPPPTRRIMDSLAGMSVNERRSFWDDELSRCFKCYACRAACPLCYCDRCITDDNQPQWVCVAAHGIGIVEWHFNRAMHMAGRCVQCGACTTACPVGIPIGLLTVVATQATEREFGYQAGMKCDAPAALSSFKTEDKESFIQ